MSAGVGAKKVIWIAELFRPEHSSALQFLNDNTTEELSFFAVEVELWRISDSPLAPKFEVLVKPNDWVKSGREQARAASSASTTKQLQLKFWSVLSEKLESIGSGIRPQKPRPQHWLNISIGRAGAKLSVTANTREDRLGVELYFWSRCETKLYESSTKQGRDRKSPRLHTRLARVAGRSSMPHSQVGIRTLPSTMKRAGRNTRIGSFNASSKWTKFSDLLSKICHDLPKI
jgi:hypothetical protein